MPDSNEFLVLVDCSKNIKKPVLPSRKGPIVVLIYYGHAMPKGGYCPPNDFITPVMEPIFKKIADDAWKELSKK